MGEWEGRRQYKYQGEWHDCDCQTQWRLYHAYLLAGIPEEYMRLDWERDFSGDRGISTALRNYLGRWPTAKKLGMGVQFHGETLGVGKTFAAAHLAKELVKQNENVRFIRFQQLYRAIVAKDDDVLNSAYNDKVLVIDEVPKPFNDKAAATVADAFEEIIRERSAWNRVTIITTNLPQEQINLHYPRVFSLLSAKSIPVEMTGKDARQGHIAQNNMMMLMNEEHPPIS